MAREFKRRHLIYYLNVKDAFTDEQIGQLVDISEGGLMLMSTEPFQYSEVLKLKIDAPSLDGKKISSISFEAEQIWAKQDINPNFYVAGFRVLDIEHNDAILIKELIDQLGFKD